MHRDQVQQMEERVQKRAAHLWETEGKHGEVADYEGRARELIAIEDNPDFGKEAVDHRIDDSEPLLSVEGQADTPTLTDQGEEETAPHWPPKGRDA